MCGASASAQSDTQAAAPAAETAPETRPIARPESDGSADAATAPAETAPTRGPVTNLPMPRYVSVKSSRANVRRGPSRAHRVDWIFRHRNTPVRITGEYGHWRRIVDVDGAGGWIHYALLSGTRSAIVLRDGQQILSQPGQGGTPVALAEQGALLRLQSCDRDWCSVRAEGIDGWIEKAAIWGVDPGETFEK
ncbi:aspartyl-trna synthetase [Rhodobacteraceae bacterium KN286]|uniref:Aspartyl-trna synthetase n=2 Tax=Oceanomicrobium pacificus TaxID=2692916 RepID=A0A6B0TU28_9RHOB|nr:aspartyl-trna synthetase [Oceanomicrobium pacificus]